jgi:hypothetical protein
MTSLVERLRARLPICPFAEKAPKHDLEPTDLCPVCLDYGDERSKNLCHGADTRIMDEAADRIKALEAGLRVLLALDEAMEKTSVDPDEYYAALRNARALLAEGGSDAEPS